MSRIGKQFITIPERVNIKLEGQKVSIDGPKGSLSRILPASICCTIDQENQKLFLHKTQNSKHISNIRKITVFPRGLVNIVVLLGRSWVDFILPPFVLRKVACPVLEAK